MLNNKKGYGFININKLPKGDFISEDLPNNNWAITGRYNDIAKNHCGAVLVTNLSIYFENIGYKNLMIDNNERETFINIHKIVGNGPVPTINTKIKLYFSNRGYILGHNNLSSFQDIKNAIKRKHPVSLLLMRNLADWHWVMAIGFREYHSGEKYLRIVDGWNNTYNNFYKINYGSYCISKTEHWIKN